MMYGEKTKVLCFHLCCMHIVGFPKRQISFSLHSYFIKDSIIN